MNGEALVATYSGIQEANIASGLLRANGLPCRLVHDDAGTMYPQLHQGLGVRLMVPERFASQAEGVLADAQATPLVEDEGE